MKKITVYIPITHVEKVKSAMFKAGAGVFGGYSHCSWQVDGMGQFMPHENTSPHIGKKNMISYVKEVRVEMLCMDNYVEDVIYSLHESHPYEVPAYDVIHIENAINKKKKS